MRNPLSGLSLRDLEYAVAVGHERHFGRAAERCHVSQAALSEQIRKLEDLLGVVLFERTKRHVQPTARGAELLVEAEYLLGEARAFLAAARAAAEPMTGPLRLGAIATLGPYYVPSLIRAVRERFPRLELRLAEGLTHDLLRALRTGELDAALVALPVEAAGFTETPLFFEAFQLACPADHPLSATADLRLADVPHDQLLLMEEGHCLRNQTLSLCDVPRIERHTRYASSLEMLRHMIAAGEGYSLMPALASGDGHGGDGLIAYREFERGEAGRTIALVWRATETRAAELQTFATFLRGALPAGVRPVAAGM